MGDNFMLDQIEMKTLIDIAKEAGTAIMSIYNQDYDIELKDDRSPLTLADRESNKIIISSLTKQYPQIPYISEETKQTPYERRKHWEYHWLIDPLDGTKEFIKKNDEFTVNIALINKSTPVLGLIYIPAKDTIYYAIQNQGSKKIIKDSEPAAIKAKKTADPKKLIVVGSRSHANSELMDLIESKKKQYDEVELISAGSSIKFCLVAEGLADIYPRTGPTMEWDTAAGHAIVSESGKQVLKFNSDDPLTYNKQNLLNDWFIVR
jgi:3'(2'), 5'-bisphosphate nucleotidase